MHSGDVVIVDFGIPVGSTPALARLAIVVTADETLPKSDRLWPTYSTSTDCLIANCTLAVELDKKTAERVFYPTRGDQHANDRSTHKLNVTLRAIRTRWPEIHLLRSL